ncbi:transposable element Tcb2 transposase [Trichonephila clavipes]|nr:transposable element Tcb2 transposase [Trichonephila clavipes]
MVSDRPNVEAMRNKHYRVAFAANSLVGTVKFNQLRTQRCHSDHVIPTDAVCKKKKKRKSSERLPLVLIRGAVTILWYVHYILQPHELPLMQRLSGAIFQKDNARLHTARVSQDCLPTVTTLSWPAQSSDLSPISHIWDRLGWRVGYEFE